MGEYIRILGSWGARIWGLRREKKNIIVAISILILSMGVFFYPTPKEWYVLASKNQDAICQFKNRTGCVTGVKSDQEVKKEEDNEVERNISLESLHPIHKVGTYTYDNQPKKEKETARNCTSIKETVSSAELDSNKVLEMVAGHPIEKMAPYILKRDKKVGSFLLAIAKKESDWGVHSPLKSGRDCYNYWGYRGKENTTDSGYSCFDSPEHAVKVVGDRIEKLIYQKVNTPAKMVVWKCGRDCEAAGGQAAANKWISHVALYYGKLNS